MTRKNYSELVLSFVLVFVIACDGPTVDGEWVAEESTAGDTTTVITTSGQVWPERRAPIIDLSIGVLEGDATLMFGEVSRIASDGRGGVYVFDRLVPILRHFDSTGAHVREIGAAGEGPGEYQSRILGMAVDTAGTLYVVDWGNARINRYTTDGTALASWPLEQPFLTTTRGRWVRTDSRDRVLVRSRFSGRPAVLAFENGAAVDTLWVPDLPSVPDARGGPYTVERLWGLHPEGYIVAGVNSTYFLEHHRASSVLRFGRRVEPRRVHAEEATEIRRRFEWMEAQPSYRPPAGEWVPEFMPPFSGVEVADDGTVWVRRNVEPISSGRSAREGAEPLLTWVQPHTYDVFDGQGRFLGEISFPHDVEPVLFGDGEVWGIRRGSFDEEYVVRMRVVADDN